MPVNECFSCVSQKNDGVRLLTVDLRGSVVGVVRQDSTVAPDSVLAVE